MSELEVLAASELEVEAVELDDVPVLDVDPSAPTDASALKMAPINPPPGGGGGLLALAWSVPAALVADPPP
ncbi:MAG TPA: hypothetical protein VMA54_12300 [Steroidobacteraceae bacterium]|nr:hypothetical protein [Steroidobacteraceae bacterium]